MARVSKAVVVFLLANWPGQDYFAPQALGYFLYLLTIGILLTWVCARLYRREGLLG